MIESLEKMKVLIAEDDAVSRKLLETNLIKNGFDVVSAIDGINALELINDDDSIRLAILDWMMPNMDGVDVCRKLKSENSRPFIYVIMLTAKNSTDDIVKALETGADDYIVKPFNKTELLSRVKAGMRIIDLEISLNHKITELEKALNHIKQLQGILPICAWCKKIRTDSDYWQNVETYFHEYSGLEFTHSICPECLAKKYGEAESFGKKPKS